jgi:hypothetical protein
VVLSFPQIYRGKFVMGDLSWWANISELCTIPLTVFGYWQMFRGGWSSVMSIGKKWAAGAAFAIVIGIWLMHLAAFFGLVDRGTVQGAADSTTKPPNWDAPLRRVYGQTFKNQTIELDGREFVKSTFEHVTFVYNGTAPTRLIDNTSTDHQLQSSNPVVLQTMDLMRMMFPGGSTFT